MSRQSNISDFSSLLNLLEGEGLLVSVTGNTTGVSLSGITDDSRQTIRGGLFVAIEGATVDGHEFISDALVAGAGAIVCEREPQPILSDVPIATVTNGRKALSLLAHNFYQRPSQNLRLVGVTGTNGKTTTCWLVHHMLTQIGRTVGLIGTIENKIAGKTRAAGLTTPSPVTLNRLLAEMVASRCTETVMEVSSHALAQDRVAGLRFSVGVFTNLTRDHLDYHKTWTNYAEAKKRLFTSLPADATAVVNSDDASWSQMLDATAATAASYGTGSEADHRFEIVENQIDGLRIRIDGDTRRYRLAGRFNAYNLTAAYSVGLALGFEAADVLDALESADPVPGRLEQFKFDSGVTAIVDYAHTPDALQNALSATRDTAPANTTIWCIFGCGGDRDPGKRPEMGRIAEAFADRVIVTSDNPRTEAPEAILDDIRAGMRRPERAEWIVDRREAIRFAGRGTASGDIVLVAGKGHEPYQVIGTERVHLDDREEVLRWFK